MNRGYIKLWRSSVDNPLYFLEPFTKWQAWCDLLILANHKPNTINVRGNMVFVDRGQVAAGEVFLAERWGWSRNKIRRFFVTLEKTGNLKQQKSHILSIYSIENWEKYQASDTTERQQKDNRKTTDEPHLRMTNNEEKKKASRLEVKEILEQIPESRRILFEEWIRYKSERREHYKPTGLRSLIEKWKTVSNEDLSAMIKNSMANNYSGLFELRTSKPKSSHIAVSQSTNPEDYKL